MIEKKKILQQLKESEERFRNLVLQAPVGTCLYVGPEMKVEVINDLMIKYWGKDKSVVNKPLTEAIPELKNQQFIEILKDVYEKGEIYEGKAAPADLEVDGVLGRYYFDFTYKPLFDKNNKVYAIINTAIDVTEQVISKIKLEESESFSNIVFHNSPIGNLVFTGRNMIIRSANNSILSILGRDNAIIGVSFIEAFPEFQYTPLPDRLQKVFDTGETFYQPEEKLSIIKYGVEEIGYYSYTYQALRNLNNEIYGIIVTAIDISEQVISRKKIEESQLFANGLIENSLMAQCVWFGYDMVFTMVNQKMLEIFGRDNSILGMKYMDAIPELITTPLMDRLRKVLNTGETFRQPEEEFTLLRNGKPYTGIFTYTYQALTNTIGENYGVICTCMEVTELVNSRKKLESLSDSLALQVKEKTKDLQRSNKDLMQFAHVASHDLKEPVRKIKTFINRLQTESEATLSGKSQLFIDKIQNATDRMYQMIDGILIYSELNTPKQAVSKIKLDDIILAIENDLEVKIQDKAALIIKDKLPEIEGAEVLIYQLFLNLLSNSLKFSKKNTPPIIKISGSYLQLNKMEMVKIVVNDNGIGFDPDYATEIFGTFARLNSKDDFEGTGLGLALCERIVSRHGGTISANASLGIGAEFIILLPIKQTDFI
ncbi:MAG: PAS domain-containing protein [Flavobacterium sp.]